MSTTAELTATLSLARSLADAGGAFEQFAWSDWQQVDGNKWKSPGGRVLSDAVFQRMKGQGGPAVQKRAAAHAQKRDATAAGIKATADKAGREGLSQDEHDNALRTLTAMPKTHLLAAAKSLGVPVVEGDTAHRVRVNITRHLADRLAAATALRRDEDGPQQLSPAEHAIVRNVADRTKNPDGSHSPEKYAAAVAGRVRETLARGQGMRLTVHQAGRGTLADVRIERVDGTDLIDHTGRRWTGEDIRSRAAHLTPIPSSAAPPAPAASPSLPKYPGRGNDAIDPPPPPPPPPAPIPPTGLLAPTGRFHGSPLRDDMLHRRATGLTRVAFDAAAGKLDSLVRDRNRPLSPEGVKAAVGDLSPQTLDALRMKLLGRPAYGDPGGRLDAGEAMHQLITTATFARGPRLSSPAPQAKAAAVAARTSPGSSPAEAAGVKAAASLPALPPKAAQVLAGFERKQTDTFGRRAAGVFQSVTGFFARAGHALAHPELLGPAVGIGLGAAAGAGIGALVGGPFGVGVGTSLGAAVGGWAGDFAGKLITTKRARVAVRKLLRQTVPAAGATLAGIGTGVVTTPLAGAAVLAVANPVGIGAGVATGSFESFWKLVGGIATAPVAVASAVYGSLRGAVEPSAAKQRKREGTSLRLPRKMAEQPAASPAARPDPVQVVKGMLSAAARAAGDPPPQIDDQRIRFALLVAAAVHGDDAGTAAGFSDGNPFEAFAWSDWTQMPNGSWKSPGGRWLTDAKFQAHKAAGKAEPPPTRAGRAKDAVKRGGRGGRPGGEDGGQESRGVEGRPRRGQRREEGERRRG